MVGKVGKEKTIFNMKNGCFPLTSLQLFMISSPLGQQPGEGSPGWLAHMAQTGEMLGEMLTIFFYPMMAFMASFNLRGPGLSLLTMLLAQRRTCQSCKVVPQFPSCWKFNHHQEGFSLAETSSWLAPWSFLWCVLSLPSSSTTTLLPFHPLDSCPIFH